MKKRTEELLKKVDEAHDWDHDQTYGGSGTRLSQTATCRVCGLIREWSSDTQNGNDGRYTFTSASGISLSLRNVAALPC